MKQYDLLAPISKEEGIDFISASGAELVDAKGKRYIDMNEMCIVLGQKNDSYTKEMISALQGITSGKLGFSLSKEQLYRYLMKSTDGDFSAIHLTVSGSEAVEWAVKLAKKMTGRSEVISFWNSIHGRTHLSASMSGLPRRKTGYGPLASGIVFAPYPDCARCPVGGNRKSCGFACINLLERKYKYESAQDAAAVIVEPYQGGGVIVPPPGYMKVLFEWTKSHGMMLIMDEIQSGMGRTGEMYCYQREGIQPDMLLLGKALGNGIHISALLVKEVPQLELLPPLSGGVGDDILACTAACEVFRQLEDGLLDHVRQVGNVLQKGLKDMEEFDCVLETRGIGLASAIEFKEADLCTAVWKAICNAGFLAGRSGKAIFCKPPYIITEDQIYDFLKVLKQAIKDNYRVNK
jgi:4-aminobutyrate aminotransferase-like enzyme